MTTDPLPSLVGYRPEEATEAAEALGVTLVWVTTEPPRWLSPIHEPRVARQREREDGCLELLLVEVPVVG